MNSKLSISISIYIPPNSKKMADNRKSWTIQVNFDPISVRLSYTIYCIIRRNKKLASCKSVNERKISVKS